MNIYSIYNSRLTCLKETKSKVDDMAHQVKVHVAAWIHMVEGKNLYYTYAK